MKFQPVALLPETGQIVSVTTRNPGRGGSTWCRAEDEEQKSEWRELSKPNSRGLFHVCDRDQMGRNLINVIGLNPGDLESTDQS
ncbi:hypothetical protein Ciccas_009501 [Cichlidogyrus casuarinus]|uniref:Uncharacterized protein n=1 Tax=Cichlidogyrus casuarinus TaxID=1844966 RepID=A0ABD2PX29_9PLAT